MQWPVSVFPFNFINQDANLLGGKNTLEDSLEVEDTENTTQENKRHKNEKEEKTQRGLGLIRNELPNYFLIFLTIYWTMFLTLTAFLKHLDKKPGDTRH